MVLSASIPVKRACKVSTHGSEPRQIRSCRISLRQRCELAGPDAVGVELMTGGSDDDRGTGRLPYGQAAPSLLWSSIYRSVSIPILLDLH